MACEAGSPFVGKSLFDTALPSREFQQIATMGLAWLAIVVVQVVCSYAKRIAIVQVDQIARIRLTSSVLSSLLRERGAFRSNGRDVGEELSRTMTDPVTLVNSAGIGTMLDCITGSIGFLGLTVVGLYLDWVMAIGCVAGAIAALVLQTRAPAQLLQANGMVSQARADTTSSAGNLLAAWRTVIRFGTIARESRRFETVLDNLAGCEVAAQRVQLKSGARNGMLSSAMPIALMWLGAYRMTTGGMSFGTLIAFFGLIWNITGAMTLVYRSVVGVLIGVGQAEFVLSLKDRDVKADARPVCYCDATSGPSQAVTINHMVVRAGTCRVVVSDLRLDPGRMYLLVGNSGSGKTILLETLAGLRHAELLSIKIGSSLFDSDDYPYYARQSGYVRKDEILLDDSLASNIMYGKPDTASEEAKALMKMFRIQRSMDASVRDLSSGEMHRVCFGREILRAPFLFLVDEGLDSVEPELRECVLQTIRNKHPWCPIIVCTHNRGGFTGTAGVIQIVQGKAVFRRNPATGDDG